MLDVIIRGGEVVTPSGVGIWDIGILDGKIVAITQDGDLSAEGGRLVDATRCIVIPGGIDPHVHIWPEAQSDGSVVLHSDPLAMSRAAVLGGTTTLIDFAHVGPGQAMEAACEFKLGVWKGAASDYAFHVLLQGTIADRTLREIPEAIAAGFQSFKVFTTDVMPTVEGMMVELGAIRSLVKALARAGGVLAVHAEDNDLVMSGYRDHIARGETGLLALPDIHSALAEEVAVARLLTMTRDIPDAVLYLMHLGASRAMDALRVARGQGQSVFGEVLHNYLVFSDEQYRSGRAALFHTFPALRSSDDQARMWSGIADGTIHTVATDASTISQEVKGRGATVLDATGGHAGVQVRIPVSYTEIVAKRGLSLSRFVELTSSNAARIFGLYPQKGVIQVGSDADLAVLSVGAPRALSSKALQETDYSIWDGYEVAAWPQATLLRGRIVVDEGTFAGVFGGQFVARGRVQPEAIANV